MEMYRSIRPQPNHVSEMFCRFLQVTLACQDHRQSPMHFHVVGLQSQHVAIMPGRFVELTACPQQLRQHAAEMEIVIVSNEDELPYQHPPLSKEYMSGAMSLDRLR